MFASPRRTRIPAKDCKAMNSNLQVVRNCKLEELAISKSILIKHLECFTSDDVTMQPKEDSKPIINHNTRDFSSIDQ